MGASCADLDVFLQYGGSPVKVGEEEYSLFRDHEYVKALSSMEYQAGMLTFATRLLAKINE